MPVPVEPPPSRYAFPARGELVAARDELVVTGGDLAPGTVLAAYRAGLFPMPLPHGRLGWWSPDPRGVLPLDGFRRTRSLRRSARHFEVRVDSAFEAVVRGCADPRRPHGWIDSRVAAAYTGLHRTGWAHSVEAWTPDGRLAGGLYGLELGGLFAGESMFHVPAPWARDASKVALGALVDVLAGAGGQRLLDVQWATPHLVSLGVVELSRAEYLRRLACALDLPPAVGASNPSGLSPGPVPRAPAHAPPRPPPGSVDHGEGDLFGAI